MYKQCGFDATLKPSTLFMLSELEAKLEDLLSALDQMPEDYVIKVNRGRQAGRRAKHHSGGQKASRRLRGQKASRRLLIGALLEDDVEGGGWGA